MAAVEGVRYREAGPDDDAAIRALLAECYPDNPKADPALTAWQYWGNPFGPTRSVVAEDAEGRLVSHWSAVAVPLVLDGRRVVGGKGVDIATAPAWRGKQVFTTLARRLVEVCRSDGVPVVLTHPNPSSAGAVARAGAMPVADVPVFVRPLDPAWVAERFGAPVALAGAATRLGFRGPVRSRDDVVVGAPATLLVDEHGLDVLAVQAADRDRAGVDRGAAWWRWRYGERPGGAYRVAAVRRGGQLVGAAAATDQDAFGGRFRFVLELLAVDRQAAAAALGALIDDAPGAAGLALAALRGTRLAQGARAGGLRQLPRRLEPNPLRFAVLPTGPLPRGLRWRFAWGDLDHL